MGKRSDRLDDESREFLQRQRLFFVATAAEGSRINLSPKGMDSLRVQDEQHILWLNMTGSGNETATHLGSDGRITLMWCAFEGSPRILRVYGRGRAVHPRDEDWDALLKLLPEQVGTRQLIDVHIQLVQTSCGFGVPFYEFVGERDQLTRSAEAKGPEGIREYWVKKNQLSLDGEPTGIIQP